MIAAKIVTHIWRLGHVALDATRPGAVHRVKVVSRSVQLPLMALQTKGIPRQLQLHRMRVVAVAATNSSVEHCALHVGTVYVNLLFDLPVVMIKAIADDRWLVRIVETLSSRVARLHQLTMRMAARAGFNLHVRFQGHGALRQIGFLVDHPRSLFRLFESDDESLRFDVGFRRCQIRFARCSRRLFLLRLGPLHVLRPGAVTGFAGHIHIRPRRVVGESVRVEILLQIGRVAVGAHVVPIKMTTRPVQQIVVRYGLIRIQMIPTLTAFLFGP